jgi:hypothetical protein
MMLFFRRLKDIISTLFQLFKIFHHQKYIAALSMTKVIFHDFTDQENTTTAFHDLPGWGNPAACNILAEKILSKQ